MIAVHSPYCLYALKKLKPNGLALQSVIETVFFKDQFYYMKSFILKAVLLLGIAGTMLPNVNAQVLQRQITTSPYKDSVVAAGTKYFSFFSTPSGLQGVSFSGVKAASGGGTVNSYVILQVRTDTMPGTATGSWIDYVYPGTTKRDTLFMTDLTTVQGYQWPVPTQFFNGVRAKVVSTGTQKFYVYYSQLRR